MKPVIIGNATLYLADCMEVLPTLPMVQAQATLFDFVDNVPQQKNLID